MLDRSFVRSSKADCNKEAHEQVRKTRIGKSANEIYLVFPRCGVPFSVKASESLLISGC